MDLFRKYQILAPEPLLSAHQLEQIANIVELASEDEDLFSAIMNFEYLQAQENGLLKPNEIQEYLEKRNTLLERINSDAQTQPNKDPKPLAQTR